MRAYLNDHLFFPHSSGPDCEEMIDRLISLGDRIINLDLPLYYHDNIFQREVLRPSVNISSWLKANKEKKSKFVALYQKIQIYTNQGDPNSYYSYFIDREEQSADNTAFSDAYEYALTDIKSILLNFSTIIPQKEILILKDNLNPKSVYSFHNENDLVIFLQNQGLLKRYYQPTDTHRPIEAETILTDVALFEPTSFGNRKNRLYRRIGYPDELWCLDRLHRGSSAHLEVFSESQKKQINISCVDRIEFFRDLTDKEKKRHLIIEKMP